VASQRRIRKRRASARNIWAVLRGTTDKASGQLLASAGNTKTVSACRSRLIYYRLAEHARAAGIDPYTAMRETARCALAKVRSNLCVSGRVVRRACLRYRRSLGPGCGSAVREMARVLRPSGRPVLGELGRWSIWVSCAASVVGSVPRPWKAGGVEHRERTPDARPSSEGCRSQWSAVPSMTSRFAS
jgi:hypothetical protein